MCEMLWNGELKKNESEGVGGQSERIELKKMMGNKDDGKRNRNLGHVRKLSKKNIVV